MIHIHHDARVQIKSFCFKNNRKFLGLGIIIRFHLISNYVLTYLKNRLCKFYAYFLNFVVNNCLFLANRRRIIEMASHKWVQFNRKWPILWKSCKISCKEIEKIGSEINRNCRNSDQNYTRTKPWKSMYLHTKVVRWKNAR